MSYPDPRYLGDTGDAETAGGAPVFQLCGIPGRPSARLALSQPLAADGRRRTGRADLPERDRQALAPPNAHTCR